jgi:IS605 OrfB family transposase
MVEATRTVRIPLIIPDDRRDDLHQTHLKYQHCQNQTVEYCWPIKPKQPDDLITDKGEAEAVLYDQLREDTDGLHANLVQKAIKDATSAVGAAKSNWESGDRVSKPDFDDADDPSWSMTYDKRAATYHRYKVSLATVNGRVQARYVLPRKLKAAPYARYVLDRRWRFSTSKLVYDGDRFWLHAVMKRHYTASEAVDESGSDTHSGDSTRVLGVDLNVDGYSAVTSAGGFHGNADYLNHRRERFESLRAELQQTGTRSAHLRMKQRKGHEWRWFDQYAHDVANGIVADAVQVGATHIAFERLTHIRQRISNLPKFQQWFFRRVQECVEYKLEEYGIECRQVNPRNTSRACSRTDCDCTSDANREGKTFRCTACGYEVNADYNAAKNVGFALLDSLSDSADVPASHTRSSGRATSQLALMSGALTPAGSFASREWESTGKPTASAVGG